MGTARYRAASLMVMRRRASSPAPAWTLGGKAVASRPVAIRGLVFSPACQRVFARAPIGCFRGLGPQASDSRQPASGPRDAVRNRAGDPPRPPPRTRQRSSWGPFPAIRAVLHSKQRACRPLRHPGPIVQRNLLKVKHFVTLDLDSPVAQRGPVPSLDTSCRAFPRGDSARN